MNGGSTVSRVAYFSMEVALDPAMPTYSGGLGILAGDTLRSAADLGVPMVAVTLLHRKGYFRQRIDDAFRALSLMDLQGKGRAPGDPWQTLNQLLLSLCEPAGRPKARHATAA